MKSTRILTFIAAVVLAAVSASAQMGGGMMGGNVPEDVSKMMQEQNKALAQASMQYMSVFAGALHTQAAQRRDQIDGAFIKSAFAEMKRAYGMIEGFQNAHVKTMDAKMLTRVQPMMERMNRNLATIRKDLDLLEKEVEGGRDLDRIASLAGAVLGSLNDMPKGAGGPQGMPGPGHQHMMK